MIDPTHRTFVWLAALLLGGCSSCGDRLGDPPPGPCGHAHNDYEHQRPLHDALAAGFCSVEADVHLVDGALLVAHERSKTRPDRTLRALYLDPLREIVRERGRARAAGGDLLLLVDVKGAPGPTYAALDALLREYTEMLTVYRDGERQRGAVTVLVSGNVARSKIEAQSVRYAAIDGRTFDIGKGAPTSRIPLVSSDWTWHFTWRGQGAMPAFERGNLRTLVSRAHADGRKLRFWGSPDTPAVWKLLIDEGLDLINADDLEGAAKALAGARR